MTVFRCARFPDGEAPIRTTAGLVHFKDGSATVDDPELAQALREVPAVFEITEEAAEVSRPPAKPRGRSQTKEA